MENMTLVLCGFAAGVVNSVAGGGALIIFPVLISMGLPAKTANTTTSVGVYGGQMSSAYGYKKFLKNLDSRLYIFLFLGLFGGAIGAYVLGRISNNIFEDIAPWFVLLAVVLLLLQPVLSKKITNTNKSSGIPHTAMFLFLCIIALLISIYGGFFGAGMGIVIFAIIGFAGIKNVHQINGIKNLITIAVNTSANVYFVISGLIEWDKAIFLILGSALGGYIGSKTASRLPATLIRSFVITAGMVAATILFRR